VIVVAVENNDAARALDPLLLVGEVGLVILSQIQAKLLALAVDANQNSAGVTAVSDPQLVGVVVEVGHGLRSPGNVLI